MTHYRHEYMTPEFSDMLNILIALDTNSIYEEYHVVKAIECCARELTKEIYEQYLHLTPIQRVNETYFDTEWYIDSHIEKNRKIDDTFLTKTPTNHRIRFSFQKMKADIDMQNIIRNVLYSDDEIEDICKHVFTEELKTDNPVILIQPAFMNFIIKSEKYRLNILTAMLSHELRHITEQYVLET